MGLWYRNRQQTETCVHDVKIDRSLDCCTSLKRPSSLTISWLVDANRVRPSLITEEEDALDVLGEGAGVVVTAWKEGRRKLSSDDQLTEVRGALRSAVCLLALSGLKTGKQACR